MPAEACHLAFWRVVRGHLAGFSLIGPSRLPMTVMRRVCAARGLRIGGEVDVGQFRNGCQMHVGGKAGTDHGNARAHQPKTSRAVLVVAPKSPFASTYKPSAYA
jgi:hypothetical protein